MATSSPLRRLSNWGVRLVLPLAVFGAVLSVFLGEMVSIDHELQLIAPRQAPPNRPIAVSALLFEDLTDLGRPELVPAEVEVWVVDGETEVARVTLTPSPAGAAMGSIPGLPQGDFTVRALAIVDGQDAASLESRLRVAVDAQPLPWSPRLAHAAQHFSLEPVEPVGIAAVPEPFDMRVRGGLCVPETPCALLVYGGSPPVSLRLVGSAAITPGDPPDPAIETRGLVALPFVAHGPDVSAVVEAMRGGELVARRGIQIPIALGTPGLERIEDDPPTFRAHVLTDRPIIVDGFSRGHWERSWVFEDAGRPFVLDGATGWGRIQVRQNPFSSDHAASSFVVGHEEGDSGPFDGDSLQAPPGPTPLRREWVAAVGSAGVIPMPDAVSGRAEDEARISARQGLLRGVALAAIVLGMLVLALVFVRRGVDAAVEAQQIMANTGDPELMSQRHRRRTLLSALAIVATALAAFLGAAAVVIARARLLE
ncbi:MAG: hypothetical protein AB8I08_31685 [Sandaracinaceae bacterium]